jgi:hypothetical protein
MNAAIKAGRVVRRNGCPPYLENSEVDEFINQVNKETLINNCILLKDVSKMVFF